MSERFDYLKLNVLQKIYKVFSIGHTCVRWMRKLSIRFGTRESQVLQNIMDFGENEILIFIKFVKLLSNFKSYN